MWHWSSVQDCAITPKRWIEPTWWAWWRWDHEQCPWGVSLPDVRHFSFVTTSWALTLAAPRRHKNIGVVSITRFSKSLLDWGPSLKTQIALRNWARSSPWQGLYCIYVHILMFLCSRYSGPSRVPMQTISMISSHCLLNTVHPIPTIQVPFNLPSLLAKTNPFWVWTTQFSLGGFVLLMCCMCMMKILNGELYFWLNHPHYLYLLLGHVKILHQARSKWNLKTFRHCSGVELFLGRLSTKEDVTWTLQKLFYHPGKSFWSVYDIKSITYKLGHPPYFFGSVICGGNHWEEEAVMQCWPEWCNHYRTRAHHIYLCAGMLILFTCLFTDCNPFLVPLCNLFEGVVERVWWQPQLSHHVQLYYRLHQKLSRQVEVGSTEVVEQVGVICMGGVI